jgi:uncharacterized protein YutE (UPF0331/DUF86 family)
MKEEIKERLIKYLQFLEDEVQDYSVFKALGWEVYRVNRSKRRDVERWVENLVNSSIDISKLILTAEEVPLPETYREIVLFLSLIEGFDKKGMERLSGWVRLRNIIAHQYLDLRWRSIKRFIDESQPFYEDFLRCVRNYIHKKLQASR